MRTMDSETGDHIWRGLRLSAQGKDLKGWSGGRSRSNARITGAGPADAPIRPPTYFFDVGSVAQKLLMVVSFTSRVEKPATLRKCTTTTVSRSHQSLAIVQRPSLSRCHAFIASNVRI